MTPETEAAYTKAQEEIGKISEPLKGTDYFEFLEELASHLECLIDCYKDEHPEEFA